MGVGVTERDETIAKLLLLTPDQLADQVIDGVKANIQGADFTQAGDALDALVILAKRAQDG